MTNMKPATWNLKPAPHQRSSRAPHERTALSPTLSHQQLTTTGSKTFPKPERSSSPPRLWTWDFGPWASNMKPETWNLKPSCTPHLAPHFSARPIKLASKVTRPPCITTPSPNTPFASTTPKTPRSFLRLSKKSKKLTTRPPPPPTANCQLSTDRPTSG
jgi:hypothetical protein